MIRNSSALLRKKGLGWSYNNQKLTHNSQIEWVCIIKICANWLDLENWKRIRLSCEQNQQEAELPSPCDSQFSVWICKLSYLSSSDNQNPNDMKKYSTQKHSLHANHVSIVATFIRFLSIIWREKDPWQISYCWRSLLNLSHTCAC